MVKDQNSSVLSMEQFKEFRTFISIIKYDFEDLCIVGGQFRSRCNSNTCIVEAYFEYFNNLDFIVGEIKTLVKILSPLSKRTKITIRVDSEFVNFSDGYQTVKVNRITPDYCNNKFITANEFDDLILNIADGNISVVKETIPKTIVCNINKMAGEIGANSVQIRHLEDSLDKGSLVISPPGQKALLEYEYVLKRNLLTSMEKGYCFPFSILPFIFNKSDMTVDFSFSENQNALLLKYRTKVDELSIAVYGRASYLKLDNE